MVSDTVTAFVDPFAQLFAHSLRSPILRYPSEEGLEFEEVWFPSLDGVVLEGWFIPCKGSDKLIIANHPMPCNRYGYAGHLPGFTLFGGFECSFIKDYKHLHDSGYNVLCYDLRNHGRSGTGSGGVVGCGQLECRDVVGSILYARSRPDTKGMAIGLLSRCLGANSTIIAISRYPQYFTDIKALLALQPVSARAFIGKGAENAGVDKEEALKEFDTNIFHRTGLHLDELSPIPHAKDVKIPTLVAQVHRDLSTYPEDVQEIYDKLGAKEKELFWIEGTTRRFDGYNYFGSHPERMLGWFKKHF
ncbi:Alpha/Beta hydrolase protein [Ilyonectria robusta]|uniref:Alpha/Beta hydrolase protein n=1 Tax=Ilyonectria robusta TaxID=1079257 RepID=UPI001E8E06CF|nr:Alpha/Beta hydrolase protein [Ilyonectria robusta]KAH8683666.1 Alpha/Beta hydrolase protein [Ilyonectria robusta]